MQNTDIFCLFLKKFVYLIIYFLTVYKFNQMIFGKKFVNSIVLFVALFNISIQAKNTISVFKKDLHSCDIPIGIKIRKLADFKNHIRKASFNLNKNINILKRNFTTEEGICEPMNFRTYCPKISSLVF